MDDPRPPRDEGDVAGDDPTLPVGLRRPADGPHPLVLLRRAALGAYQLALLLLTAGLVAGLVASRAGASGPVDGPPTWLPALEVALLALAVPPGAVALRLWSAYRRGAAALPARAPDRSQILGGELGDLRRNALYGGLCPTWAALAWSYAFDVTPTIGLLLLVGASHLAAYAYLGVRAGRGDWRA